jgi:hypothetical protein
MSWRRISAWLNRAGIKTHRGKTWSVTGSSVHSVIKSMRQRTERPGPGHLPEMVVQYFAECRQNKQQSASRFTALRR